MSFSNDAATAAEGAAAYIAAMMDLLGDRNPIAVLAVTPDRLEARVRTLPSSRLRVPEREGKWSVISVVRHLADVETIYAYRLRMVVAHDEPAIPGFDQDLWAERLVYAEADLDEALDLFRTVRRATVNWLRGLPDAAWERVGLHAERGPESLLHMVRLCAAHDLVHLAQIDRVNT